MALTDKITAVADAIRSKTGKTATMTLAEMPAEILDISGLDDTANEYSQMNTQTAAYLVAADAAYTDSNSSTTTVMPSYASTANKYDDCAGYALSLASAGTLYLLDETEPARSWKLTVSAGNYTVYNLIPEHIYRYLLVNASGVTVQNGKLKATGKVRMIRMSYMSNVRDMGGWACAAGTVKYGKLYRGQATSASTGDQKIMLEHLRIGAEIDLRGDEETGNATSSNLGAGVEYFRYPMETGYKPLVDLTTADKQYMSTREALKRIMENTFLNVPTYFHCSIGCDRTGVIGYMVGALLGMSRADIDKNYELSSLTGMVETADVTGRLRTRTDWNNMANYLQTLGGSTPEQNVINWCARVGISAKLINRFRAAMCSGTPATVSFNNTVTNNLTNAATSNSASTVANGGSYTATVTAADGATIESVKIIMAEKDITSTVYNAETGVISVDEVLGDIVITASATYNTALVTLNLTDVTAANSAGYAIIGLSYTNTLSTTPDKRFDTVTVTMVGTDITSAAYNAETGNISIGTVTGAIVITAVASLIPVNYTNMIPTAQTATGTDVFNSIGYQDGKYLSSASNGESTDASFFATGFIPCSMTTQTGNLTIYVKGADWTAASHCRMGFYMTDKSLINTYAGNSTANIGDSGRFFILTVLDATAKYWKLEAVMKNTNTPQIVDTMGGIGFIRFSLSGSGNGVIITLNEPIEAQAV